MEYLIEIDGEKLSALELQILAYIAGECEGVWTSEDEESVGEILESVDQLVLSGFLVRDSSESVWLNTWRVPNDAWDSLGRHTEMISTVIDMIGDS